ncbi:hypothetical protein GCM10020331_026840 [Ectobacillus funiculus]
MADIIPNMSDRMLSERLKELESEGIVVRTVYPEVPVRIEYALSEKKEQLLKPLCRKCKKNGQSNGYKRSL